MKSLLYLLPLVELASSFSCPLPGASFPPPHLKPSDVAMLNDLIKLLPKDNTTTLSLTLTSTHDTLWSHHQPAAVLDKSSTTTISAHSIYRIASVTKVFTVLTGMTLGWTGAETLSSLIPEVRLRRSGRNHPEWEKITVGMLGGHQAGLAREWGHLDLAEHLAMVPPPVMEAFPNVTTHDAAPCGVNGVCTRARYFDGVLKKPAVLNPGAPASYSNVGFALLGYAVESATHKPWMTVLKEKVLAPLGMKDTTTSTPPANRVVIPAVTNVYGLDVGHDNPAGGLYSTPHDLTILVRAILARRIPGLTDSAVRTWLKPTSFTASMGNFFGNPWEIIRSKELTKDKRVIDVYTKSGDLPGYYSNIIMLPEFGVGMTVLAAGKRMLATVAPDAVLSVLVPKIDEIARHQAQKTFGGVFVSDDGEAELEISTDDAGPGLLLKKWTSRGEDVLAVLALMRGGGQPGKLEARLFPTEVVRHEKSQVVWRMLHEFVPASMPEMPKMTQILTRADVCWTQVDTIMWGGRPVNEFVFEVKGGKAVEVSVDGLRVTMKRGKKDQY